MCKFEIFSQKYAFSFMALCVHFPLRLNHLGTLPWIMPGDFRALGKLLR